MQKQLFFFLFFIVLNTTTSAQRFLSSENIIFHSDIVAPAAINATDLDGDNDIDIIAALEGEIFWYKNIGGSQIFGSRQILDTLPAILTSLCTGDLDGDSYTDVIVTYDSMIVWYKNSGSDGVFNSVQAIAKLSNELQYIYSADLDGDADLDLISAARNSNQLSWYENTNGEASFTVKQLITTKADFIKSIYTADLDGDGDNDILTASAFDDKIAWYENTDGAGTFGEQIVITTLADFAHSVYAADLDGDGDMDVLSASAGDDKIAWYKNTDSHGIFSAQIVVSIYADYPQYVYAEDLDGDGDLDIFSASLFDDKVAWYENIDGEGMFASEELITSLADQAGFVFAGDLDDDGDKDVITASCDFKISWHENTLPLRIEGNPISQFVNLNSTASLGISANEYATSFQWQVDMGDGYKDLLNSEFYANVTTDSLKITDFTSDMSGYKYRCLISDGSNFLTSDGAVLMEAPSDKLIKADKNCYARIPDYTSDLNYTQEPVPYTKISGSRTVVLRNNLDNSQEITFNVDVIDQSAPVFTILPVNWILEENDEGAFVLPNFSNSSIVSDNCDNFEELAVNQVPPPSSIITELITEVVLTATDSKGNSSQSSIIVELSDQIAPVITSIHNEQYLSADENCTAILPDYTKNVVAVDDKSRLSDLEITQEPLPWTNISGPINEVTITVTDPAKNSTQITFNVVVEDITKPIIACGDDHIVNLEEGVNIYRISGTEFDPKAVFDNCSISTVTNSFNNSSSLDNSEIPIGTNEIIWTAIDEAGNESQCTFTITVNGNTGIINLEEQGISIYPNPSKGEFHYKTANLQLLQMKISDMTGKVLIEKTELGETGIIDLSEYSAGIYLCSITTKKGQFVIKIINEAK